MFDERIYISIKQCIYLLKWFGYTKFSDLYKKNKKMYTQTSPMLEYIIVRGIYLLNYGELNMMSNGTFIEDSLYFKLFIKKMIDSSNIFDYLFSHMKCKSKNNRMEYYSIH